jgi:hypothetical protein
MNKIALYFKLPRVTGKSNLAYLDAIAAKYCNRFGSNRNYHCNGLDDGFLQQPVIKVSLLIIQVTATWKQ